MTDTDDSPLPDTGPSRAILLTMALATGMSVAGLYYAQPLLHQMALEFGVSTASASLLVTLSQLGYAVGLLLIVPLGDMLERRGLVVAMTLLSVLTLLATALAPHFAVLAVGIALTGILAVVAQVLVAFAASLAPDAIRGKVVGTIMTGLMLGILLARTASGLITAATGSWRSIFAVAALGMLGLAVLLWRLLPRRAPLHSSSYGGLIASVLRLVLGDPVVRSRALIGSLSFGMFAAFWTTLTFLLAGPAYGYSEGVIGLFGLVGAAGALSANLSGRLTDRIAPHRLVLGTLGLFTASWALLAAAPMSLTALVLGVIFLDVAAAATNICNQGVIYQRPAAERSRLTAGYMCCAFLGGAVGSVAGAWAWTHGGWGGVVGLGLVMGLTALAVAGTSLRLVENRTAAG
ncbi:MFS transporter [Amphibiibacter pelophylacis]|uniref:MFS transporter n=1 Tax=Amphibiibacter pelophylacis TaxID=1799477 RepID=A0ACC6P5B4_9BURK